MFIQQLRAYETAGHSGVGWAGIAERLEGIAKASCGIGTVPLRFCADFGVALRCTCDSFMCSSIFLVDPNHKVIVLQGEDLRLFDYSRLLYKFNSRNTIPVSRKQPEYLI